MADSYARTDGSVVGLVDELLLRARVERASDVHFEPTGNGLHVRFRIDGLLHDIDALPQAWAENVVARLKVLGGLLTYRVDVPQEGSFTLPPGLGGAPATDVRIATFPTIHGERAVARLLSSATAVTELAELGFEHRMAERLRTVVHAPSGLVLVTGPAGAGKSTTLYALARHLLQATPGRCVISLEDPVEQRVPGITQIQVQPHGELDYVRAMRSLLRQDVQVLLVGEIRDAATAHIVVEAALTGHLILSTMHCGDPAECVGRLLEMGIAPYQVASVLSAVVAQRLVRRLCPTCHGTGCDACAATGYRGRTACGCVLEMDAALHAAVLRQAPLAELRALNETRGGGLPADAVRLVQAAISSDAEIARVLGAPPAQTVPDAARAGRRQPQGETHALV